MVGRFVVLAFAVGAAAGCKDNATDASSSTPVTVTDAQLYSLQAVPSGWTYYKFSTDTLPKSSSSAHPGSRLFVRYNAKAASQLGATGKVKSGAVFPDSSFIVKELFTGSARTAYAFMFKLHGSSTADPNGWVWSEQDNSGGIIASASQKGSGCIGCHSAGVDYTRMNDAHP